MDATEVAFPAPVIGPSRSLGHFVDAEAFERFTTAYREAALLLPDARACSLPTGAGVVRAYRFGPTGPTGPDAVPVMLISGRDASTPMWAPTLPDLLTLDRPVISLDSLGGPGCSSQTAPQRTAADQAAWVAEAIRGLGLERVHLVGHSLGGWLAVQVAAHHPEVLASVAALDPARTFAELSPGFVAAGLAASTSLVPAPWRRRLVRWIAGEPMSLADPVDRLGWASITCFRARQPAPRLPTAELLAALEVPVLAVLAGRSRVHDAARAERTARTVPGAVVEVWPDAGHCLHAEHPRRLAARLADHVSGTEA